MQFETIDLKVGKNGLGNYLILINEMGEALKNLNGTAPNYRPLTPQDSFEGANLQFFNNDFIYESTAKNIIKEVLYRVDKQKQLTKFEVVK